MMPMPPGAPLTVRLAARLGPEVVAALLAAIVVVVAVAVVFTGLLRLGSIVPSPSPSVVATASQSALPPTASPSAPPSNPARAELEIVDRLETQRAALKIEVARSRTDASAIADLLREVNQSLVLQNVPLAQLSAEPGTADLIARIQTMNGATFEAVRRTQQASVTNTRAYRAGAVGVIAALKPLAELRLQVATLAGEAPKPS
jgi:hypothetical protein